MNFANTSTATGVTGNAPTQIAGMDGTNKAVWGNGAAASQTPANPQGTTQATPQPAATQPLTTLQKLEAKYGKAAESAPATDFGKLFGSQAATGSSNVEPTKPATHNSQTPPAATNHWDTSGEALTGKFGNLDVSSYIKPEQMQAALGGDATEMMAILNTSIKMASMVAYKQAMEDAKSGVSNETTNLTSKLPDMFKDLSISNQFGQDPILSAPEFAPIVDSVRAKVLAAYPRASEAEVKEAVVDYLKGIGSQFGSQQPSTQPQPTSNAVDWDKMFANA